jgi:hypothetical protein
MDVIRTPRQRPLGKLDQMPMVREEDHLRPLR